MAKSYTVARLSVDLEANSAKFTEALTRAENNATRSTNKMIRAFANLERGTREVADKFDKQIIKMQKSVRKAVAPITMSFNLLVKTIKNLTRPFKTIYKVMAAPFIKLMKVLDKVKSKLSGVTKAATNTVKSFAKFAAVTGSALLVGLTAFTVKAAQSTLEMQRLGDRVGISYDKMNSFSLIASQTGVSIESVTDAMKDMNVRIQDAAINKGGAMVDFFKNINESATKWAKMDVSKQFENFANVLSEMPLSEAQFWADEINDSMYRMLPILRKGAEYFRSMQEEANLFRVSLANREGIMTMQANLARLSAIATGIFGNLAGVVSNALDQPIQDAIAAFKKYVKESGGVESVVRNLVVDFLLGMARMLKGFQKFVDEIERVINKVRGFFGLEEKLEVKFDTTQAEIQLDRINKQFFDKQHELDVAIKEGKSESTLTKIKDDLAELEEQAVLLSDQLDEASSLQKRLDAFKETGMTLPWDTKRGLMTDLVAFNESLAETGTLTATAVKWLQDAAKTLANAPTGNEKKEDSNKKNTLKLDTKAYQNNLKATIDYNNQLADIMYKAGNNEAEIARLNTEKTIKALEMGLSVKRELYKNEPKRLEQIEKATQAAISRQQLLGERKQKDILLQKNLKRLQLLGETKDAAISQVNSNEREELLALKDGLSNKLINYEEYERRKTEIATKYADKRKDIELKHSKDLANAVMKSFQMQSSTINGFTSGDLNKLGKNWDNFFNGNKDQQRNWGMVLEDSLNVAGAMFTQVTDMYVQNKQREIDAQQRALDSEMSKRRDAINNNDNLTTEQKKKQLKELDKEEKERTAIINKERKKLFETQKKMQIAQAMMSTASAVIGALGNQPWTPANFALAAMVGALGAAQIGVVAGQQFSGQAHSGMDEIPNTGNQTWMLQGGERVVQKPQNVQLKKFLSEWEQMSNNKTQTKPESTATVRDDIASTYLAKSSETLGSTFGKDITKYSQSTEQQGSNVKIDAGLTINGDVVGETERFSQLLSDHRDQIAAEQSNLKRAYGY